PGCGSSHILSSTLNIGISTSWNSETRTASGFTSPDSSAETWLGIPQTTVFLRLHASRLLLSVGPADSMAARRVRSPDYSFLLLHSAGAPLFCPQAARSPFQLDVRHVRGFHSGLRHYAPDGSVDGMARQLP